MFLSATWGHDGQHTALLGRAAAKLGSAALLLTVSCGICREEGVVKDPFGVREGGEEDEHNAGVNGQASEMDES